MIFVISGLVGEGKSFSACDMGIEHLLSGGVVATNMKLHLDVIQKRFHRALKSWQYVPIDAQDDPRKIPRGDFRGSAGARRVMVILDEALNWFASQGGAKDERKATWGEWLRQSDKLGQDVYFIAQSFDRAAKWIRELAQVAIHVRALKNLTFLRIPFGRLWFLRNLYGVTRYDCNSQHVLSWRVRAYDKRIFGCYETAELYGFDASDNAYLGSVARSFRLPFWPFLLPLSIFVLGVIYAATS